MDGGGQLIVSPPVCPVHLARSVIATAAANWPGRNDEKVGWWGAADGEGLEVADDDNGGCC